MSNKRRGLSLGTVLAICLTVIVSAGCVWMLSKMRAENSDARMGAQKVAGVLGSVLSGQSIETATPIPQSTVRTVTVTLAPSAPSQGTEQPTEAVIAPTATPAPSSYSFTMSFSGLLGFHSDVSDSVQENKSDSANYQPLFSYLSDSLVADFNTGIFPHVINKTDQKYADVLVQPGVLEAIKTAGFDDLMLNSEHALDYGVLGIQDTVNAITEQGITCSGVNSGAANQNRMLQINSARIAMLAYTDALTTKGKNTLATKAGQSTITLFDTEIVKKDIQSAKEQGAHCIIAFLHWGKADATTITNEQRKIAQQLADMGADIIIGFHPSRVLPIEILESTDENGESRQVLVVYSMGTLLTESRNGYDISGILLHLKVNCTSEGKVRFESIEYTPTYIWRQNMDGRMQYRVICSNQAPPERMDQNQMEVMGRALTRIQNTLNGSPIVERKIQ